MLGWALTFLVLALIAGLLGFSGIAGASANIAWIFFVVFLVLDGGRRGRPCASRARPRLTRNRRYSHELGLRSKATGSSSRAR